MPSLFVVAAVAAAPQPNRALDDSVPEIIQATRAGNIERVRGILDRDPEAVTARHPDITKGDSQWSGRTALHCAAAEGRVPIVRLLLSRKADPDSRDHGWEHTPLHLAHDAETAEVLLAAGADPMARDVHGGTPLHEARDAEIARALLGAGAGVNDARNEYNESPLHDAARAGRADVVKLLLDRGAAVDALDTWNHTPLFEGADTVDEVVRLLLDHGAKADAPGDFYDQPLYEAVAAGRAGIVRLLVGHKADARRVYAEGYTCLHIAALSGRAEVADYLVALGLDVNARTKKGETPLYFAAKGGHLPCVKSLLAKGADPRARTNEGITPLAAADVHYAFVPPQGRSHDVEQAESRWREERKERRQVVELLRQSAAGKTAARSPASR
jgi:ankyrin repeat protein